MSDLLRLSALYELYSFIKIYVDKCSFKVPSPDNKIFFFYLENYVNKTLFYKHRHLKILNFFGVGVSSYHVPGEAYGCGEEAQSSHTTGHEAILASVQYTRTLLEKYWRISLTEVTDGVIAKHCVKQSLVKQREMVENFVILN